MRLAGLLLAVTAFNACTGVAGSGQLPPSTATLVNGAFDAEGAGIPGWAERGQEYGRARLVTSAYVSPPRAVELEVHASRGSSGNDSFMLYQVLDPAPYRGRTVRFGAKVRTAGGAVNMTLFTPERTANDFFQTLQSGKFVERSGALAVPGNASFLSFGIQIMGPAGAKAYLDDVFVTADGGNPPPAPPATPASSEGASGASQSAEVRIDAAKPGAQVNPLVFGMHLEWSDGGNGLADVGTGALRPSAVQALVALRVPIFRFPGGIHADYYDWRGGTGPSDRRAMATNIFTSKRESQAFGSPEVIDLARAAGASLLITANYGTGTPEDAGEWARYLRNASARAAYWEIGNEIYLADSAGDQPNGRRIAKAGDAYAADFPRFQSAIKSADPQAKVGLIAHVDSGAFSLAPASRRDWTSRMLGALRTRADFVSVHNGYAPVLIDDAVRFDDAAARARVYRAMYAATKDTAENLEEVARLLDARAETRNLPIAITEWGPLFGYSTRPQIHSWYVDQSRTMAAAVYVASMLDLFLGQERVLLATYTNPIHRWYGSLLTHTDRGLVRTPSYYVYELYRRRFETHLVPASVSTSRFESASVGIVKAHRDVPELVARASLSAGGERLTALLVNRSLDHPLDTRVAVTGFTARRADCQVLSAPTPNAINGQSLTNSTAGSGSPIEPRAMACAPGAPMKVSVPPSGVVSIVMER